MEEETVPEPNSNPNLVGPTVPTGEKEYQKRNFAETFEQPPFTAMSPVIEIDHNGKPVKNRRGEVQWMNEFMRKGEQAKNGLTKKDSPIF
jgi:hypothetical protein